MTITPLHVLPSSSAIPFYITGGTLSREASSYVTRQADTELLSGLLAGEYCYVLNSRQMGKSSLCVRTIARLQEERVRTAFVDLTRIGGQSVSPEQWYVGLLAEIGRELGLRTEFLRYWKENQEFSLVQRLFGALREVAAERMELPFVIFVDEIDTVKSLAFSTDEFFAAIRECYVARVSDSRLKRFTFCLIGTATPTDLVQDTRITPFNIGRRIVIEDFTAAEATVLAQGLASDGRDGNLLLSRVLHWTSGHPYLTQSLCRRLAEGEQVRTAEDVDRLCERTFLAASAREADDNLAFVRRRILGSELDSSSLLALYGRVLGGRETVADDEASSYVAALRLSGIVKAVKGRLVVRNRIYARVFDVAWIERSFPDAELRRVKAHYRASSIKGLTLVAVVLLMPKLSEAVSTLPHLNAYYFITNGPPFGPAEVRRGMLLFGTITTLLASYIALVVFRPLTVTLRELVLPTLGSLILGGILPTLYILFNIEYTPVPGSSNYWRSLVLSTCFYFGLGMAGGGVFYLTLFRKRRGETLATYAHIAAASTTPAIYLGSTLALVLSSPELVTTRAHLSYALILQFLVQPSQYIIANALLGYGVGAFVTRRKRSLQMLFIILVLYTAFSSGGFTTTTIVATLVLATLLMSISRYLLRQVAQETLFRDAQDIEAISTAQSEPK